ncbi:MAG: 23S rRNA pseudouridine1911/1915/1917 synthase [Rhodothermales bacterium]|jgi:23S rRNA pseudouridine1911/1915/1917 synthase
MDILYIDNHLLAVNKPCGLPTQPSQEHADSLECRAKAWIKKEYNKPGKVFLHAIHRLDRPVSGVVLFARTSKALSRLNASTRARDSQKIYNAVVHGQPAASGDLEHFLAHRRMRAEVTSASADGAKQARLSYTRLAVGGKFSLLEITLHTGRYHQIRAQFAAIGHPIVGDHKYQAPGQDGSGIALHHSSLTIPHPTTREPIAISATRPSRAPWDKFSAAR